MTEPAVMMERITSEQVRRYKKEVLDQCVLVSVRAAAEVLSVHPDTVKRLIVSGRIAGYNRHAGARGLRVLASELREYVRGIRLDRDAWEE